MPADEPWLVAVGDYFCRVWRSAGYYRPCCLDLSYPELKIAVEYQGQLHGRQYARDIERVERLRAEGWIVIQVTSGLLKDPTALVRRLRDALVSRGWRG
ncbi:hypothetical protein [Paramicrobacterium agarici]|uniref:hypothetical protein n=1 Tax=Paramicrobacterium agarici TaxID=630514 RepID=UPI00114FF32E|nr:hypothetical protein [Microbacterium agarici]